MLDKCLCGAYHLIGLPISFNDAPPHPTNTCQTDNDESLKSQRSAILKDEYKSGFSPEGIANLESKLNNINTGTLTQMTCAAHLSMLLILLAYAKSGTKVGNLNNLRELHEN